MTMTTTPKCGECPHYQTGRTTSMSALGMHSCAKGFPWTYYDGAHVCHRPEAQPAPTNRPAPQPRHGQTGLPGDSA